VSLQEGSLGQSRGGEGIEKGRDHLQSCGRKERCFWGSARGHREFITAQGDTESLG